MKIKINSFYLICAILAEIAIVNLLIIVVMMRGHAGTVRQSGGMPSAAARTVKTDSLNSAEKATAIRPGKTTEAGKAAKSAGNTKAGKEKTSILLGGNIHGIGVIDKAFGYMFRNFNRDFGIVEIQKRDYLTVEKKNFIATAYDLSYESCGKYPSHPAYGITFTGTKAVKGRTIAVDPGVIPLGSRVYIEFPKEYSDMDGWYIAEDTGSKVKGSIVDVFMGRSATKEARQFGRRHVRVKVAFPLNR